MKKTSAVSILLVSLVLFPGMVISQQKWQLHKESDGIKSYTRKVPGSSFYECMGKTIINAEIERVAEMIRDIPTYPRWFARCKEIRLLKKFSPDNMFIYFVYDAPWPVKDRDLVVKTRVKRHWQQGRAQITVNPHPAYPFPRNDNYIRITSLSIEFTLTYISRKKTHITMIFKVDPAGSVPASLANIVTRNHPLKTLRGMKKTINSKRYYMLAEKSIDREPVEKFLAGKKRIGDKLVDISESTGSADLKK